MTTQIHHINNVYHYRRNLKLHAVLIKQKKLHAVSKKKKEIFFFQGKKLHGVRNSQLRLVMDQVSGHTP